jgi:putative ABC transport system substrate-binding protein
VDAVVIQGSLPVKLTVDLALKYRLPSLSTQKSAVQAGILMSYSASFAERARVIASYVDKILKGVQPADLPVQQPTKYEIAINLKTAKALGLTVPPSLLARADVVIE